MNNNIRACAGTACALAFLTVGCVPVAGPGTVGYVQTGYVAQPAYSSYGYGYSTPTYTNYGYTSGYYAPGYGYGYYPGYNAANVVGAGLLGFGLGAATYGYGRGYNNYNNYTYINRGVSYRGPYHGGYYHGGYRGGYGGYHGIYHGGYRGTGPVVMPRGGGGFHR